MFCYIFERIFLVTTIFGKHKKLLPNASRGYGPHKPHQFIL